MTQENIRRIAGGAVLLVLVGARSASAGEPDLLALIAKYEELSNEHRVEEMAALFTDEARLDFGPLGTIEGKALISGIHDYDRALGTELSLEDCRVEGHSVACRAVERNKWLLTAGILEIVYTESVFSFDENLLIESVSATLAPDSAEAMGGAMAAFGAWALERRPEAYAALFRQDGSFNYSYDVGQRVLALLKEWKQAPDRE